MAVLPSHVPCYGPNIVHRWWSKEGNSSLYHEEIRFHTDAGGRSKIQDHKLGDGSADCRGTHNE
jgi:hypothetical protein